MRFATKSHAKRQTHTHSHKHTRTQTIQSNKSNYKIVGGEAYRLALFIPAAPTYLMRKHTDRNNERPVASPPQDLPLNFQKTHT